MASWSKGYEATREDSAKQKYGNEDQILDRCRQDPSEPFRLVRGGLRDLRQANDEGSVQLQHAVLQKPLVQVLSGPGALPNRREYREDSGLKVEFSDTPLRREPEATVDKCHPLS